MYDVCNKKINNQINTCKCFYEPLDHNTIPIITRGGLGRLATWHSPGGPVGPPARWAATLNVKGGSGTREEALGLLAREGGLYSDELFPVPPSSWLRR